jgi:ABC-type Fe3+-hydroxamate transport system substrate-binding protein
MSPTDYLNRLRINEAKKQLKQESCVLKDVAESVGYGNEYYFSRKFKQSLGIAPSLYMKKDQIRVATASLMGLHENLSSLGLHPVAIMDGFPDRELDEVEQQQRLVAQLEKLRQAKPDLIIGDFYHKSFYDKLKSIAPTVILDQAHDWKENHLRLAELVGREQQALQNFKQLELRSLDIGLRLKHHFGQERIMLMQVTNQSIRLQENAEHPLHHFIYRELGLKPAQIISTDLMSDEYAAESIPMLDTDHLFIHRVSNSPVSEKLLRRMKQTTAWNRSPAVLRGSVHDISDWTARSWTPIGRHQIMDDVEQIVQQLVTLSRVGLIGQL